MAKKICQDDRLQEGLAAATEEDSGTKLVSNFQTAGISISSEKKPITESKKRRRGDDGNVVAAIAAYKELQGEDAVVVARKQLGSRNKLPKVPLIGIREMSADTMRSHLLEVPSGFNVIHNLEAFIHSCRRGVIVMSARGKVHNFTLRQPVAVGGTVDNTRVFEIISLTRAFPRAADTLGPTGFKVNLRDAQGNLVGGTVESMIAHGSVLVILGTVLAINPEVLNVGPKLPELFLTPAARAAQQHFQAPLMTVQQQMDQSAPPMALQKGMDIHSDPHMVLQYGIAATEMHPVRPSYGIESTDGHSRPSYGIGAMDIQPTTRMTMQKPIHMMSMNNLVPNLSIGLARPNLQELPSSWL